MSEDKTQLIKELEETAKKIRKHGISMTLKAGLEGGHLGPGFSMVEIMTTLYFAVMRKDPENPGWPDRDRFVLSKGHGVLGLYPVLAECGYFPVETLDTFEKYGSCLAGHPSMKGTPGIECSTGSLGHGLSIGLGMALAAKIDKKDYYTYVLIGDGEQNEGMIWEAVMAAKQYQLDNLVAIVDRNNMQSDGNSPGIMDLNPLPEKWADFGWEVREVDGHDIGELIDAFDKGKRPKDKPYVIIAHTVKGKGVSFFEHNNAWHHACISEADADIALKEIEKGLSKGGAGR